MIFPARFNPCHHQLQPLPLSSHMAFSTWLFLPQGSGCETSPAEKGVLETHRKLPQSSLDWRPEVGSCGSLALSLSLSLSDSTCFIRIVGRCICILAAYHSACYNKQINKNVSLKDCLLPSWKLILNFWLFSL